MRVNVLGGIYKLKFRQWQLLNFRFSMCLVYGFCISKKIFMWKHYLCSVCGICSEVEFV